MNFHRRHLLASALATPFLGARAAEGKVLRVGFQKAEPTQLAAKQHQDLEKLLIPLGWDVQWSEFQFGPPLLEAMRVGSIDLGAVGDTPPVFAQAARADLLYVSALRSGSQAILLPPGSPIQTLADLKGKKLAFGRGSSAHNFALKALTKAGLRYTDVEAINLGPADGGAAFQRGAIDATNADVGEQPSFFMARKAFVQANPAIIAKALEAFATSCAWVRGHRDEVSDTLSESTGMPVDAMRRVIDRVPAEMLPMTDEIVRSQQDIANRFRAQGLLPVDITVADSVWHPNA